MSDTKKYREEYKLIPLTQGKFAKVDVEAFDFLSRFKWFAYKNKSGWYASKAIYLNGKKTSVSMHRYIIGFPNQHIDHKNMDGLDNRLCNLRKCTPVQNQYNKKTQRTKIHSIYKGVHPYGKKWVAKTSHQGIEIKIGVFSTEIEAAKAYDEKAKSLHKEFANLNYNQANNSLSGTNQGNVGGSDENIPDGEQARGENE